MNYDDRLDAEVAALMKASPMGAFDWSTFDLGMVPSFRKAIRAEGVQRGDVTRHDLYAHAGRDGHAVAVRHYRSSVSAGVPSPCLIWLHGGGFMMGTHLLDEPLLERWAAELGCSIITVDYRLAPEHQYPTLLEDCYEACAWAASEAADLGIDPRRLIVGGASAGGGLAAALALLSRDRGGPPIAGQVLIYPMLDDRTARYASSHIDAPIWGQRANEVAWAAYLGGHRDGDVSPYAAPARATDLSNLPPAVVMACGLDVLRDEAIDYAIRLLEADVDVELHVYPRVPHIFDVVAPDASVSQRFGRDVAEALGRTLLAQSR